MAVARDSKQLICVRAQLEDDFARSKGNGAREAKLWELVASMMSFQCTGEECERDWKELVSRYKGRKLTQENEFSVLEEIDALAFSEEDSSKSDDREESEAENVQDDLDDIFQQMPGVHPGWLWQDGTVVKGETQAIVSEKAMECKEEVVVEERMPRWGHSETKELISIRASMEQDPVLLPHKNLWEPIAAKMRERGYARSSEQCKRKWKKLLSRYKEKKSDNGRKFLFFQDMEEIFKARLQTQARNGIGEKTPEDSDLNLNGHLSDDDADSIDFPRKKRKTDGMHQVVSDFIVKQQAMEKRWQELLQRKHQEWQQRELEWMAAMEKLQQQRMEREKAWKDREEQRRAREEIRAQKWDKLFAVLAERLQDDD